MDDTYSAYVPRYHTIQQRSQEMSLVVACCVPSLWRRFPPYVLRSVAAAYCCDAGPWYPPKQHYARPYYDCSSVSGTTVTLLHRYTMFNLLNLNAPPCLSRAHLRAITFNHKMNPIREPVCGMPWVGIQDVTVAVINAVACARCTCRNEAFAA